MSERIKAVILCGGQGTRIRDVADDIPKPMIRIGERPILWHIMSIYARFGVKDFVLCLGYRGWTIKEFFLNYDAIVSDLTVSLGRRDETAHLGSHPEEDWNVTLAETGLASQTGHRLFRVRKYLESSPLFCVTYGDGVADVDIDRLLAFHREHGRVATVTGVRPTGRFGVMKLDEEHGLPFVRDFHEKPQSAEGVINGGFFVFDHRLWDYLSDEPGEVLEQAPLQKLAAAGELVMYEHTGFWQPMDTYREYRLLNDMWSAGNAPWLG